MKTEVAIRTELDRRVGRVFQADGVDRLSHLRRLGLIIGDMQRVDCRPDDPMYGVVVWTPEEKGRSTWRFAGSDWRLFVF